MKRTLSTAFFVTTLLAAPVYAASNAGNWYGGVSGDLTWLRHSDTGGGGNLDVGYQTLPGNMGDWRLEAEAGYHAAGSDHFGITHYDTYMGNLYYDFNTAFSPMSSGWHIVPYIGGGLGDAMIHNGANGAFVGTFNRHYNSFAYQGMTGLTFANGSAPNTEWSLGYRYQGADRRDGFERLESNSAELGLRMRF